ncbi:ABC transporter permease [Amycolatopsis jejuensis]|uniref:ABC transporter permease n=1 Tax=Amycolatopsis jejuensis TaxID=330084 RepID=UPI000AE90956|nr:ABC transporter permease [Amycolatopsis jejuensis]
MAITIFLLKRIGRMAAVLVLVTFLVFSLLAMAPGSTVATLLGTQPATPDLVAALQSRYHLNDPFLVQYWHWLVDAVQGNLGTSVQSGDTVTHVIATHLPVTLELALYAGVLVILVGVPAGLVAGIRRGRPFDRAVSGATVLSMSAPPFAVGILLIYLLGVKAAVFPVFGAGSGGVFDRIEHLTLPAIALALGLVALVMRQTRAAVQDVMNQDYVTFARARGLGSGRILLRYALRNTALPIVTAIGLVLVVAISAAVLVETVFSLSGAGQLMVQAVGAKDIPVVQGLALLTALAVIVVNLATDAATLVIDPRTRTARKAGQR